MRKPSAIIVKPTKLVCACGHEYAVDQAPDICDCGNRLTGRDVARVEDGELVLFVERRAVNRP